ncbi:YhgE/Pip family protein [Knoellia subterranea]|uniref:ABC transporter n=1 Tax=Knoellia subterranea KCTC 19937 TaxID=1385521 RepID=A0A0A0JQH7_9MICO|nr:YhgE/Pip domain-containing protein [Knoellia subterranea]KGN37846.1 ABC transporter [Knoellia subterranea KCTC 19937]
MGDHMTALRVALTELRRLTDSTFARVALAAMVLVPSLYAGLYLYANKDPYANLDGLPAAVVVQDRGTTLATGEKLQVGDEVADTLITGRDLEWHRVDEQQAHHGLEEGDYAFVLTIPESFSADLASSADFTPRLANLELETNDATNYLAGTIAERVVDQVQTSVAQQVSRTAASQLLGGLSTVHDQVGKAATGSAQLASGAHDAHAGSTKLASGAAELVTGQQQLANGSAQLSSGAARLNSGLATLDQRTNSLPGQTQQLAKGARQVADGNAKVAEAGARAAAAGSRITRDLEAFDSELPTRLAGAGLTQDQIDAVLAETARLRQPIADANSTLQSTSKDLGALSSGANQVADGAEQLASASSDLESAIDTAAAGSAELATGARDLNAGQQKALTGSKDLAQGAKDLDAGLAKLDSGAAQLSSSLAEGAKGIPNPTDAQRTAVAQTIGSPVGIVSEALARAGSYGAGLAPFFLSLALWIGGFTLFTRARPLVEEALTTRWAILPVALGGWLAPAIIGVAQAILTWVIVRFAVGIDLAHPWWMLAFMVLVSMVFMAIIHGLMARLGDTGQFIALVLMVLQLVSAGGTFPWETLPGPLQWLHHVLPMSYSVAGLRTLAYGGPTTHLWLDVAVLLAWGAGALFLSTAAARRVHLRVRDQGSLAEPVGA